MNANTVQNIKKDVISYWGARAGDFAIQRKKELADTKAERWKKEILPFLPEDRKKARILDVGTGTGFFPILLAEEGYENVTGIDLTPEMIERAKELSKGLMFPPSFFVMDAEKPELDSQSFDVILTRNLTWTLPHPDMAYREWYRLLRRGGILLNFDGNYGEGEDSSVVLPANHAHKGIPAELTRKHAHILSELPNSYLKRPGVDVEFLKNAGFSTVAVDFHVSDRIYREIDELYNPVRMFKLCAKK